MVEYDDLCTIMETYVYVGPEYNWKEGGEYYKHYKCYGLSKNPYKPDEEIEDDGLPNFRQMWSQNEYTPNLLVAKIEEQIQDVIEETRFFTRPNVPGGENLNKMVLINEKTRFWQFLDKYYNDNFLVLRDEKGEPVIYAMDRAAKASLRHLKMELRPFTIQYIMAGELMELELFTVKERVKRNKKGEFYNSFDLDLHTNIRRDGHQATSLIKFWATQGPRQNRLGNAYETNTVVGAFDPRQSIELMHSINVWSGWGCSMEQAVKKIKKHPKECAQFVFNVLNVMKYYLTIDSGRTDDTLNTYKLHGHKKRVGGDYKQYIFLVNFISYCIKYPEEAVHILVALNSIEQGVGKGTLFQDVLSVIYGSSHLLLNDPKDLLGHFNNHLKNKGFIYLNEQAADDVRALKGLMDKATMLITPKGIDSREEEVKFNLVTTQNVKSKDDLGFQISKHEVDKNRRIYWQMANDGVVKQEGYDKIFVDIQAGLKEDYWMAFHYIMMNLPVPRDYYHVKVKAPKSNYHLRGLEAESTGMIHDLMDYLRQNLAQPCNGQFPVDLNPLFWYRNFGDALLESNESSASMEVLRRYKDGEGLAVVPVQYICWIIRKCLGTGMNKPYKDMGNIQIVAKLKEFEQFFTLKTTPCSLFEKEEIEKIREMRLDEDGSWQDDFKDELKKWVDPSTKEKKLFGRLYKGNNQTNVEISGHGSGEAQAFNYPGAPKDLFQGVATRDHQFVVISSKVYENTEKPTKEPRKNVLDDLILTDKPEDGRKGTHLYAPDVSKEGILRLINGLAGTDLEKSDFQKGYIKGISRTFRKRLGHEKVDGYSKR